MTAKENKNVETDPVPPRLVTEGRTPEQWVAVFAERGIKISERALRSKARELGAYWALGKAMVLLPEHIERIFEPPRPPRSSPPEGNTPGLVDYAELRRFRAKQKARRG